MVISNIDVTVAWLGLTELLTKSSGSGHDRRGEDRLEHHCRRHDPSSRNHVKIAQGRKTLIDCFFLSLFLP